MKRAMMIMMCMVLFSVAFMPTVSAFEWCDWIPFWDCSDPIILTDHTVFNKTSNVCTGSNLGMEVSVYPCEVQDVDSKNIQQYVDFEWTGNQQQDVGWVFMYSGQLKDAKIELFQNRTVYYKEDEYQNRWGSIVLEDVDSYINVGEPDQTCVQGNTNNSKMWEFTYINGSKERYCFTNIQQLTATSVRLSGNYDKLVPVTKSKVEEGWVDVTNQINYLGNDLNNQGFDYYRVRRTVFSPDEVMKTRWTYTPARPTFFGKWSILGHDAEIGLMNSINNDKYIFLDPFWNSSWSYKKEVQLNSTSTTNLTDFPIEFNLDTQTLISSGKMNSDCSDLRVIDTDDLTELSYEIEVNSCNTTYTKVYAKKPVFIENSQNDTVYVYYGNPSALDNQDAGSVWSNGYIGVMHFGNASDSINGVTWTVNNGATFEGINNLRVVNFTSASSQYLGITGTTDYRWVTDNTVYIEYNALQSGAGIHGTNTALTGGAGWSLEGGAGTNFATNWGWGFQASNQYDDDDLDTNVLKKLHFVKDDSNGTLYDTADVMESSAFSVNDQDGRVVGRRAGAGPYMQGYVNELRWTNSTRTQDWIRAESGMLSSVGAEEQLATIQVTLNSPSNGFASTSPSVSFNCTCTDETGCLNLTMTVDSVLVNTTTGDGSTNLTLLYTNSSTPDGTYNWYCTGTANDTTVANSSTFSFSVDTVLPTITILSPATQYTTLENGQSLNLNTTISDTNLDTCWYTYPSVFNGTNQIVFTCNTNTTFTYEDGSNTIFVYANDTAGNQANENRTWIVLATIDTTTYNASTYETKQETFIVNATLDSSVQTVTGNLIYNGTSYAATASLSGNVSTLSRTIDIPVFDFDTNITFYFQLNTTTISGSSIANTTDTTQEVLAINLSLCDATNNISFINYTTYVAQTPFPQLNTTFASTWEYHLSSGSGGVQKNYTFEDTTEDDSEYEFCFNVGSETIDVTNAVQADATNFTRSNNYLNDAELSNVTTVQSLYLLNDSLSTAVVLEVLDWNLFPKGDVFIDVQYYDLGTDTYITVTQAKTGSEGTDVVYVNLLDSTYKFILKEDNEIILSTLPEVLFDTVRTFIIGEEFTYVYDRFQGIDYSLNFNTATETFVLIFSKPSGAFTEGCLRVSKKDIVSSTEICDICETSSSATLSCSIAAYGNGTFLATFYGTFNPESSIDWLYVNIGDIYSDEIFEAIGEEDASFYAFLMGILLVSVMFFSPVGGILAVVLSVYISNLMGFLLIDYITLVGVTIVGLLMIWIIKR